VQPGVWEDHRRANRDLGDRARHAMRQAGMNKGDPLAPVVTLQSEILNRHTDLVADQIAAMERIARHQADALRQILDEARVAADKAARTAQAEAKAAIAQVESAADETIAHQQQLARTFETTFRADATTAMQAWAKSRRWPNRLLTVATCLGLSGFAAWAGLSYGRDTGRQDILTAIQISNPAINDILLSDGIDETAHWLQLMKWNDLDRAQSSCAPQSNGIGYRQACTYTFWDGPPLPDPPAK
jgi:hypothetical protein